MKEKKKNKRWTKFRHKVVRNILYVVLKPYVKIKYGATIDKFKEQKKRPFLILMNHQTAFDQFFVGMAFRGAVYYLASEDIFSMGPISSIIRYLIAPIPIKKQTTDVRAILNCMKVASEGGTIAIAPEGNRTFCGRTVYIKPSIVPLARKLGLPIALFRIEGGYGVHPRWSDVVRRGKMHCYVSRVINPEEYSKLSDDELMSTISEGLYVNEARVNGSYCHKRNAEYLERAIYVCPYCGLSVFESRGDTVECKRCHRKVRYTPEKELVGVGFDFPYRFVADWYDYQSDFINNFDVTNATAEPLYIDRVRISEVIPYKNKKLISKYYTVALFGNRIEGRGKGSTLDLPFDNASTVTVLGKNKLNIYYDGKIYQLKGDKRFNALKYVHVYHRYKNILKGVEHGKFLGL